MHHSSHENVLQVPIRWTVDPLGHLLLPARGQLEPVGPVFADSEDCDSTRWQRLWPVIGPAQLGGQGMSGEVPVPVPPVLYVTPTRTHTTYQTCRTTKTEITITAAEVTTAAAAHAVITTAQTVASAPVAMKPSRALPAVKNLASCRRSWASSAWVNRSQMHARRTQAVAARLPHAPPMCAPRARQSHAASTHHQILPTSPPTASTSAICPTMPLRAI
jgi:hypothetical protein